MRILLLLFLTSCQATPLLEKEFNNIHQQEYILNEWDCSNKCALYAVLLHQAGYKPIIKVYHISGKLPHAIVYVNNIYHCPTRGRTFKTNNTFGVFLWDVTIEEILSNKYTDYNYIK